jgi:hypothetical protein
LAVYNMENWNSTTDGWRIMQHPFAACATGTALRASFPRKKGAEARGSGLSLPVRAAILESFRDGRVGHVFSKQFAY